MKVQLESTTKIVMVNIDGARLPVRVWQGTTEAGVPITALVARVAVERDADAGELDRDLQEHAAPTPDVDAWPLSMIL